MKDDKGFTLALSWIIGGLAAAAICYMIGCALGIGRAEAPAWVQAVGSIGAIIAAYIVATHHTRANKLAEEKRIADDENQNNQVINTILGITSGIVAQMRTHWEKGQRKGILSLDLVFLRDAKDAIKEIPIFKVSDFKLAARLLMLPKSLQYLENCILEAGDNDSAEVYKAVLNAFVAVEQIIDGNVDDEGKLI